MKLNIWNPTKDKNSRPGGSELWITITKKSKSINLSSSLIEFLNIKHRESKLLFVENEKGEWFIALSDNGYPVSIKGAIGVVYALSLIAELAVKLDIEAEKERFKVEREPVEIEGLKLHRIIPNEFNSRP